MTHTVESLIRFRDRVKNAFEAKQIRAPVHLASGNEVQTLLACEGIRKQDWKFSTWRSMYVALACGLPEDLVFEEILAGRSMYLMNAEYRLMCSSIVGGMLPIATGIALAAKLKGLDEHCYVFIGDMCAKGGAYHEFSEYCAGHQLPVTAIIEDNKLSTQTPTREVWGESSLRIRTIRYEYERTCPHVGSGRHVQFL